MDAIDEALFQKAEEYASRHHIILGSPLGLGVHGLVMVAGRHAHSARTAIKVHRDREPYCRERDAYERLAERSVAEACGFHVPRFVSCDESLWIIEMTIVTRPYVLDFAGAYLDHPPDFPENVWEEWEIEKQEQYGAHWGTVRRVLNALEAYGVFLVDVSPGNVALPDESSP